MKILQNTNKFKDILYTMESVDQDQEPLDEIYEYIKYICPSYTAYTGNVSFDHSSYKHCKLDEDALKIIKPNSGSVSGGYKNSLFKLFEKPITLVGKRKLYELVKYPSISLNEIHSRHKVIKALLYTIPNTNLDNKKDKGVINFSHFSPSIPGIPSISSYSISSSINDDDFYAGSSPQ